MHVEKPGKKKRDGEEKRLLGGAEDSGRDGGVKVSCCREREASQAQLSGTY